MEKKSAVDFRFGKVIGEGSFSTVYLAKDVTSGKEYAIKVCDKETIIKEKKSEYIKREKLALQILNSSPGIISLSCTFHDSQKLFYVLTFAAKGELLKYINKTESLSLECVKFYAAELLLAIEEMHKKNIIHRDLKPENLLLSHDWHLMIADFGSSKILSEDYDYELAQEQVEVERANVENESDDEISNERARSSRRRRASFVGTAQYVSPEILKGNAAHLSTDLWAFGCILYQMISGSPPFRGATEYLIFQKILNLDFEFPDSLDPEAKDLISKLLRFDPKDRLGSSDESNEARYPSIRNHPFFKEINWNENLYRKTPPEILPSNRQDDDTKQTDFSISDDIEPGLGERQLRRILQMEFGSSDGGNVEDFESSSSTSSLDRILEEQRTNNKWSTFVDNSELILKYGFVNKRKKGLMKRRRMFILTSKPRLLYIDPVSKVKKGEVPFDSSLRCDAKNFQMFLLHTPNRIYYLEDTEGGALSWCEAIDEAKKKYIKIS